MDFYQVAKDIVGLQLKQEQINNQLTRTGYGAPLDSLPRLPKLKPVGSPSVLPICVVCIDINFNGGQWWWANGWEYVGDAWNDKISSIIVLSGTWRFFADINLGGAHWDLGPGYYPNVVSAGIPNDTISSAEIIGF